MVHVKFKYNWNATNLWERTSALREVRSYLIYDYTPFEYRRTSSQIKGIPSYPYCNVQDPYHVSVHTLEHLSLLPGACNKEFHDVQLLCQFIEKCNMTDINLRTNHWIILHSSDLYEKLETMQV